LAEGDGVIDYNKMSKDNSPSDVREYLSMLPLGQPVLIGGGIMRVAELAITLIRALAKRKQQNERK